MRELVDNFVLRDEDSMAQLLNIWDKARQSGLTEENLVAWIDHMEQKLAVSQRLNFLRWPILNQRVHQNPQALGSFEAEVEVVRRFVKERLRWMDRRIGYTYVPSAINGVAVDLTQPQASILSVRDRLLARLWCIKAVFLREKLVFTKENRNFAGNFKIKHIL